MRPEEGHLEENVPQGERTYPGAASVRPAYSLPTRRALWSTCGQSVYGAGAPVSRAYPLAQHAGSGSAGGVSQIVADRVVKSHHIAMIGVHVWLI